MIIANSRLNIQVTLKMSKEESFDDAGDTLKVDVVVVVIAKIKTAVNLKTKN